MKPQTLRIGDDSAVGRAQARRHHIERREPLTAKFDRLMEDLETRNAEIEQFVRAVSDGSKSSLITIKGFLTLLRRDAAMGDHGLVNDDILQIGKAADRLLELLDELADYPGSLAHVTASAST